MPSAMHAWCYVLVCPWPRVRWLVEAHLRQDFQRQGARLLSGHVVKARRAARPRHAHSRAPSLSTAPPSIAAVNLQNRRRNCGGQLGKASRRGGTRTGRLSLSLSLWSPARRRHGINPSVRSGLRNPLARGTEDRTPCRCRLWIDAPCDFCERLHLQINDDEAETAPPLGLIHSERRDAVRPASK